MQPRLVPKIRRRGPRRWKEDRHLRGGRGDAAGKLENDATGIFLGGFAVMAAVVRAGVQPRVGAGTGGKHRQGQHQRGRGGGSETEPAADEQVQQGGRHESGEPRHYARGVKARVGTGEAGRRKLRKPDPAPACGSRRGDGAEFDEAPDLAGRIAAADEAAARHRGGDHGGGGEEPVAAGGQQTGHLVVPDLDFQRIGKDGYDGAEKRIAGASSNMLPSACAQFIFGC